QDAPRYNPDRQGDGRQSETWMKMEGDLRGGVPAAATAAQPGAARAGVCATEPAGPPLAASPFLHYGPDRAYNPLSDELLELGQPEFEALCLVMAGLPAPPELVRRLAERSWVAPAGSDLSRRYLLKYVSLEAHTVCNQSCYFCPV